MTTVYKFKAYYTDAGVGAVQDPAPTCTVINMADDSKLADAQATTASTNMPGLYSYSYSGADGLDCVAWFKTTDTGCDVKELASYVSEKITTMSKGVSLADDAITSAKFDESTAFPVKSADTGATQIARVGADSDTLETLSDQMDGVQTWASAAISASYTAGAISDIRGSSWSIAMTDLTLDTNKQQFCIKRRAQDADADAILFVDSDTGLIYINGAAGTASDATLVYAGTTLTLTVKTAATAQLPVGTFHYGVQSVTAAGLVEEPYGGTFSITADIVRATA